MGSKRKVVLRAIAVGAVLSLLTGGFAKAEGRSVNCSKWRFVQAPPLAQGVISQIVGTSSNDVWAIGAYQLTAAPPISLHWDGTSWKKALQQPMAGYPAGAAAISSDDVWAVGSTGSASFSMHWNGAVWAQVAVPAAGDFDYLSSVTAASADDLWAGGSTSDSQGVHPLVMRWNGAAWQQVPAPDGVLHSVNAFYGITAIAADDIWAVGYQEPASLDEQPLIEHWDGSAWMVAPSPQFSGNDNLLYEVSGTSSTDVWAVGKQGDSGGGQSPLIEHWDGQTWTEVPSPTVKGRYAFLLAVSAVAPGDAWAVGDRLPDGSSEHTLVMHWDGISWTLIRAPTPGDGALDTVAAITSRDIWAGASYYDSRLRALRPLTMHSKGCS